MNVLLASSEAVPFCKTGGLGDVAGILAREMSSRFNQTALFLPRYRQIDRGELEPAGQLMVPGFEGVEAKLLKTRTARLDVFFVDCQKYFDREHLYQEGGSDYPDNDRRFAFLCRAVLEGARLVGLKPDMIHCHDWQTALIPAYLKVLYRGENFFARTGTLLTVHNAAYQGLFLKAAFLAAGFPESEFTPEKLEYHGKFNFLKAGLMTADLLSTVSPTYAREIQGAEFGRGLEGVFRHRHEDLSGILNGLDLETWDPAADPHLPRNYDVGDCATGKAACKEALARGCGLECARGPLIGVVSRLDPQKGLDLALEVLPRFLSRGASLAVLGVGDLALAQGFAALVRKFPRKVHFHEGFDEPFAHLLYAACDIFLMPSRFEPCGLGQMIAMRYGSVPVGTSTGGLADTIVEKDPHRRQNGFIAEAAKAEEIAKALSRALKAYQSGSWPSLIRAGMESDFSWARSIERYMALYEEVRRRRDSNAIRAL